MSQVSIVDIEHNNPQIPTRFVANQGFAIPIANTLEILGDTVPAGTIPVYTTGSGNTITTNVQLSQAIAASDATRVGLAAFDSASFAVDANGFVTFTGSSFDGLTPDTGGQVLAVAGNINVFGQKAYSAQMMQTHNETGNFYIENRGWVTPYIVDTNITVGQQATYTTIQAAVNAAVADGLAAANNFAVIDLRMRPFNTYVENVSFPAGRRFLLRGPTQGMIRGPQPVYLQGLQTVGAGATVCFQNVGVFNNASDCFVNNGNIHLINSFVQGASGTGFITTYNSTLQNLNITGGFFEAYGCDLQSGGGTSIISNTQFILQDCDFGPTATAITLNGTSNGSVINCSAVNINGNTTGAVRFDNCSLFSTIDLPNAAVAYNSLQADPQSLLSQFFTTFPATHKQSTMGNVARIRTVSGSTSMGLNDQMVYADTSGSSCSLTLTTTNIMSGQQFIVGDVNGNALANNIVITPSSGLINGASSLTIDEDYGWAILTYDGTNFFAQVSCCDPADESIGELAYFSNANGDAYLNGKWLKADGSILNQASYPTLFSHLGYVNGPWTNWFTTTTFTAQTLNGIAKGAGLFAAAGAAGVIFTSTDGLAWTSRTSGTANSINSLNFGNALFVASQFGGAITSTDAITWSLRPQVLNTSASKAAAGTSNFAIAGGAGFVGYSSDGTTWNTRTPFGSAIHMGASLIQGGLNGAILTSADGVTYTARQSFTTSSITAITYNGSNLYVAGASNGNIGTSTDGVSWTPQTSGTALNITSLTFGSVFLAGLGNGTLRTSTDGITWTPQTSGTTNQLYVAFGASLYAFASLTGLIRTSTDAVTWNTQTSGTLTNLLSLKFLNSLFLTGGLSGTLLTSTDAITWTPRTTGTTAIIQALGYGAGLYLAGGSGGYIGTSTDAITWVTRVSGTTTTITGFAYNGSNYLAATGDASYTSTDAITWTKQTNIPTATNDIINTLVYQNSLYLAGTAIGNIFSSTDAITWATGTNVGVSSAINAIAYGASKYIVGGTAGVIRTSPDLTTWTARTSGTTSSINTFIAANGLIVYGGQNGALRTSTDGVQWDQITSNLPTSSVQAIAADANQFVGVGVSGLVFRSENTYPYNPATQFQLPTDAQLGITTEFTSNFRRSLYIKAK